MNDNVHQAAGILGCFSLFWKYNFGSKHTNDIFFFGKRVAIVLCHRVVVCTAAHCFMLWDLECALVGIVFVFGIAL